MSVITGLPYIYLPFSLGQQPDGVWVGSNTVFTTLDKGTYLVSWNPRALPFLGGADTVNSYHFAISINAPYSTPGSVTITESPRFGLVGQVAGNSVSSNFNNTFQINADNTSVYLYLNITTVNLGGWIANTNTTLKYLLPPQFTRI